MTDADAEAFIRAAQARLDFQRQHTQICINDVTWVVGFVQGAPYRLSPTAIHGKSDCRLPARHIVVARSDEPAILTPGVEHGHFADLAHYGFASGCDLAVLTKLARETSNTCQRRLGRAERHAEIVLRAFQRWWLRACGPVL